MKCAMELIAVAGIKAAEKETLNELKKMQEKREVEQRTIKFCEMLGNELEAKANRGEVPKTVCYLSWNNCPLRFVRNEYADRRESGKRNGDALSLEVMAHWFKQYCFEVTATPFDYWCYGWGELTGARVTISPAPNCF